MSEKKIYTFYCDWCGEPCGTSTTLRRAGDDVDCGSMECMRELRRYAMDDREERRRRADDDDYSRY